MLFQGQETGSRRPWQFFVDHGEELREPVRKGRADVRRAVRAARRPPRRRPRSPDPCAEATFRALHPRSRRARRSTAPSVQLHRDLLRAAPRRSGVHRSAPERSTARCSPTRAFALRYFAGRSGRRSPAARQPRPDVRAARSSPEPLIAPPARSRLAAAVVERGPALRRPRHAAGRSIARRLAIPAHAAVVLAPDPSARFA